MKNKFVSFLAILVFLAVFPKTISAHMIGQPPFFRINNIFSILYPVPTTSLDNFNLPQDIASENYIVNQDLNMEFDVSQLPVPEDVVSKTKFNWDFGDGDSATGLKNTHTYKKPGSYMMSIKAQYGTDPAQVIQSTLINVLPDKNYKLPVAVIKVNGEKSSDPLSDILKANFSNPVNFDSSESEKGTGKIVSYFWDFGDQKSSENAVLDHNYQNDLTQVFPVLRIKDENGFIADSFLEIENSKTTGQPQISDQGKKVISQVSNTPKMVLYGIAASVLASVLVIYLKIRSKK